MKKMPRSMVTAMCCAAAVTAQVVGGKATRDALFLTALDFTALPAMLIASSICSLILVALHARAAHKLTPARLVPASFIVSGLAFLVEWVVRAKAPSASAIVIYLHISGAGPLLASGFWLISSERFDPRTAKRRFGQIAAAGTLGGLLSAVAAERFAIWFGAPSMLLLLAGLQFLCAWLVRRLALSTPAAPVAASDTAAFPSPTAPRRSGLATVATTPYLRHLAILVLLGSTGAAMVDYLFKGQAVEAFGRGDNLLRFFALYYAGTGLLIFVLQISSGRATLERFGLGLTASTPSAALLVGSLGSLFAPGLAPLLAARGGESVFRSSLYRAGYELFYTPIAAAQKRAAKSWIDVGFDRLGDAVGGGLVHLLTVLIPATAVSGILGVAALCSAGALLAASRLNRGYIGSLETSLIHRGGGIDPSAFNQDTTRSVMRSLLQRGNVAEMARAGAAASHKGAPRLESLLGPEMQDILALGSRDRERVVAVLLNPDGLSAALVPHAIPLLAWDAIAEHAVYALRKVAEERVGQLIDALLDPNQDFAVRRRLARVFSVCVSERAAHGLVYVLDDVRFDVRCQAARSLTAILEKNPRITIDRERIFDVIRREVTVGRPVWESRRLLDGVPGESPLDAFVRDRAGESLAHVFTLLSLVFPREPLQIAFRSLHTDDEYLRGTALEYLDSVLPAPIRERLWPFLERRRQAGPARPREDVIADLLRSHESILLSLEEMRRAAGVSRQAV